MRRRREEQERWDQAEHDDVIFRLPAFEAAWWDPGWIQFAAFTQPFRGSKGLGPEAEGANPNLLLLECAESLQPGARRGAATAVRVAGEPHRPPLSQ